MEPKTLEFKPWPKLSRWSRDVIISEKLDGTSSCVIIENGQLVGCQSRNKLITPTDDNYGFAGWVDRNKEKLSSILGDGYHYGEWWGSGIQRGYGLKEKRFSLFNVTRWKDLYGNPEAEAISLYVVPTLCTTSMDYAQNAIETSMDNLKRNGSYAAEGFMYPEGVVIFHTAGGYMFKKTFEKDAEGKGQNAG